MNDPLFSDTYSDLLPIELTHKNVFRLKERERF